MATPLLITKAIEKNLPAFEKGEGLARVKWFTPWTGWTWWCSEAEAVLADGTNVPLTDPRAKDRIDVRCWGLVKGEFTEYGYWLLSELRAMRGPADLHIERDLYFGPKPLDRCAS
jgi:hypothetical protein